MSEATPGEGPSARDAVPTRRPCRRAPRRWMLREGVLGPAESLSRELGLSPRLARMLVHRGVADPAQADAFLAPRFDQLLDPFGLADMQKACDEVHAAIARGEEVTLYGDYDVDGMTATALLYWVFKKLGAKVRRQIPDRNDDGYGLTPAGLEAVKAAGSTLVVTVDQGVAAHDEIRLAAEMGIRVLVTDHHAIPAQGLPDAVAVIHPARPDQAYANPHLCGAAVAFKLGQALLLSAERPRARQAADSFVRGCVDLAALATIADMTPLVGENRTLVALGLAQMGRTRHPGLRAMLTASGRRGGQVRADDVGFGVAPLMNAAGRLSEAHLALDCLLARDPARARDLAGELKKLNQQRRRLTEDLTEQALAHSQTWADDPVGVLALDSEQAGIVGLVAGRLKDRYGKPFVVCARRGDELVGSCRSVDGFDLKAALDEVQDHLVKHGGHAQAAGLTVDPGRFEGFREALVETCRRRLDDELLTPRLDVEEEVGLGELNWALLEEIEPLAPFGVGNPAPVFVLRGCRIEDVKVMGRTKRHVRLRGEGFPGYLDPVGFHLADAVDDALEGSASVDLAFRVGRDEWLGRARLQMRLEDLRQTSA